ncbi:MAG: deoxyribose-phosphate aldolase [Salibacteraceae bacterium]
MNNNELNDWVAAQLQTNNRFITPYDNADLHKIVSCIDLTTLNSTDSSNSVQKFVADGIETLNVNKLPEVAAFCVFSNFVPLVKRATEASNIDVACVATAFPHGQADLESKTLEVKNAADNQANDIDVVINRGLVLDGNYQEMGEEIKSFSNSSGAAHLKVILEVCELNLEQVYKSSLIAMRNGADFIKTSTGKGSGGASLEASLVMCLAIKEFYKETGKMVGFKAAGGISTAENAMQYWNIVNIILGEGWLINKYFRIGASSLLKNIIADLK